MRAILFAIATCGLISAGCQTQAPPTPAELAERQHQDAWLEGSGARETLDLPAAWRDGSARVFAQNIKDWQLPKTLLWSKEGHDQLKEVLLQTSDSAHLAQLSVRAALLLARDPSTPSRNALLIRLERRLAPAERGRQGVEVVCANVLALYESLDDNSMESLLKLAAGQVPHPDLDVRVECARAYLAHVPRGEFGKTPVRARQCLRFLITVLRAETPAQATDPPTWVPVRTVAWPKGRAAAELATWFEPSASFRPDGSWQDQVDWALAAEQALGL